ncbi:hypothetical protein DH2020_044858 [Rehmannia glutinosa]|uniref:Retrotransposon Copia-like N-terminal domain-containing protein n=1 Tax=Rehmannia glutinosa TaxID=99300 RepID=A0ABR0UGF3_REHGL
MAAALNVGAAGGGDNGGIQVIQPQGQLVTIKLTDNNFLVWKQQILAAIRGYGLEGFLNGSLPPPDQFITNEENQRNLNPAYLAWMRQDQLLMSWLLSSLSEGILIGTVGLESSQAIWEALNIGFASQNGAKIMQYKLQLQTLKKGSLQMREYLNRVKSVCDLLASAGHGITDSDQVLHILSGLGPEYNPVIVSITSRLEPCSLREAHAILLSYENRLEATENIAGDSFSVHMTTQGSNSTSRRGGGGHQSNRGRGFHTNQYQGNRGRSNGRNGGFRGRGGRFGNGPRCQICHYSGHTADKCYYRLNLGFSPGMTPNNRNTSQQQSSTDGYGSSGNFSPAIHALAKVVEEASIDSSKCNGGSINRLG